MNFSFPPLPPRLADPRLRRWGPALLAALVCQVLVLAALRPTAPPAGRARRVALADDTPTLLRWSRLPPRPGPAAGLQAIPLQGLAALPPPPPDTLPGAALPGDPLPAASTRAGGHQRPPRPSPDPALPRLPGEAFRLAQQVAQGWSAKAPPAAPAVAVQRRQWWLFPHQISSVEALWNEGREQALPAALGPLPEGVAIRSFADPAAASPVALGELHGRSLLAGDQLWLLWRQGTTLWMLRGPLPGAQP